MRPRSFLKGRISKEIPLDFAVAPHIIDTALRKEAWSHPAKTHFLYWHPY
jgi:hypothetical protein